MKDSPSRVESITTTCVVVLCIAATVLIFMLPSDALVVDLIYQGF
jgi:preprotein translocase subunit SecE